MDIGGGAVGEEEEEEEEEEVQMLYFKQGEQRMRSLAFMDIGGAVGEEEEEEEEEEEVQMLYFKQISIIKIKAPCTQNRLAVRTKKKDSHTILLPLFHLHSVLQIEQLSENKVKSFSCAKVKKKIKLSLKVGNISSTF